MKQSLIWVGIGALVIIVGVYLVTSGAAKNDDAMMNPPAGGDSGAMMEETKQESDGAMMGEKKTEEGTMMKDDAAMMEEGTMMKKGSYEAYSADKLALANSGDVVLFFRASWCPTCKALDADIHANLSKIPAGLTILDVDYDNSSDMKKKYGVTYQHTFVQVDAQGNALKKWSGSPTLSALVGQVQ